MNSNYVAEIQATYCWQQQHVAGQHIAVFFKVYCNILNIFSFLHSLITFYFYSMLDNVGHFTVCCFYSMLDEQHVAGNKQHVAGQHVALV